MIRIKKNALECVLQNEDKEVTVDDAVREGALKPLERMLELAK